MRQIVSQIDFNKEGVLQVDGDTYYHLRRVLKANIGDMIYVRTPMNVQESATICFIDDKARVVKLSLCSLAKNDTNLLENKVAIDFCLMQMIAKTSRMEQIVRQATECGVNSVFLLKGEYSQGQYVKSLQEVNTKTSRLNRIVKEAMEQSGSLIQTKISPVYNLQEALIEFEKQYSEQSLRFYLTERACASDKLQEILRKIQNKIPIKAVAILVGAEGGISKNEEQYLQENNFVPVHFNTNILRCETASLYGIAVLKYEITQRCLWQI